MAKQLNVNLAFTADTKAAQAQLKQLQQQLDSIVSPKNLNMSNGFTAEIQKGIAAASELKVKLMDATNVNTGKLDLTKFSQSLKKSNRELEDYANDLAALGPQGSEAFISVARAISNAETPFLRLSNRANEFLTTLKNTARWQISSSILHGFMGTMQRAYGYAQDLNKSLNNIRIVTGKSAEDMARFAKNANAAARNLSATTLDYTDASLIYYQQGLDDRQVAARTETTIKLANVSRQSAEEVSDQMTAIWNNFYNGSKSIEYYADVITALGAATASSSDEIATGLEKFSAVAKTVGLSYEYATAALATITAQTRQSADTVGTGLRTLFARLESVNLGETLEDGVTLTKYTQALDKIGVSVLDQNGQLKSMDTILDSIAEKWSTLDETTKTATANTVGGVRQYATFLALMNNWDKMQANLGVAKGSSGTLQRQADIYAESWEAARKSVQASAEAIYDALLNDKFFITLTKALSTVLDGFNGIIKSAGGLRGVLLGLGAILSRVFSKQLSSSIANAAFGLSQFTRSGRQNAINMKDKAWDLAKNSIKDDGTTYGAARVKVIEDEARLQRQLIDNAHNMSEEERKIYQQRLDIIRTYQDEYVAQAQLLDQMQAKEGTNERQLKARISSELGEDGVNNFENYITRIRIAADKAHVLDPIKKEFLSLKDSTFTIDQLKEKLKTLPNGKEAAMQLGNVFKDLKANLKDGTITGEEFAEKIEQVLYSAEKSVEDYAQKFKDPLQKEVRKFGQEARNTEEQVLKLNDAEKQNDAITEKLGNELPKLTVKYKQLADSVTVLAQSLTTIGFAVTSIVTLVDTVQESLEDGNFTIKELIGLLPTLGMALASLMSAIDIAPKLLKVLKTPIIAVEGASLGAAGGLTAFLTSLGGILLIVGAVVGAGILLYHWLNRDAIAAKKAADEHKKLGEAADDAKSKLESLTSNLDGYDELVDKLKNANKNTKEWAEASQQVYDILQKLKSENPELMKEAEIEFINGVPVFTNEEELRKKAQASVNNADTLDYESGMYSIYKKANNTSFMNKLKDLETISSFDKWDTLYNDFLSGASTREELIKALDQYKAQEVGTGITSSKSFEKLYSDKSLQDEILEHNLANSNPTELYNYSSFLTGNLLSDKNFSDAQLELASETLANNYASIIEGLNTPEERSKAVKEFLTNFTSMWSEQEAQKSYASFVDSSKYKDQLSELEGLKSLLSNKDLTSEQLAGSNFNWSQLGTTAAGFAGMTNTEQQQRLLDYEMQLKEAYFTEAEAKLLTLSAEEQRARADELAVERAIYEKQLIQDLASAYGLNAEEIDSLTDYYEQYAAANENVADTLQGNRSEALKVAAINTRLNKGVKELGDNWENYSEVLKESKKDSVDYQRTLTQLRKHLDDVLNIDSKILSEGFFDESTGNLELMRKAAEGDTEAIEQLRMAAANDIVQQVTARIDDENLKNQVNDLNDYLTSYAGLQDLKIGANLDNSQFLDACNEMIKASGMTALEASNYFKALGYDAEVIEDQNVSESTIVTNGEWFDARTGETKRLNNITATTTTTTTVPVVKAITYTGSAGGTVNYSNKKGKGGGGGGSTKKTKNATDEIDRYHVIKEVIRDLTAEYDKINKTKDRAFGANRIKAINGEISATNKLIAAQKQYIKEIQDYLVSDSGALASGILSYTGIEANIQGGILQNYEEVMNAAIAKFNADKSETADENYENFKKLISTYEETFALFDTAEAELTDLINRNQDARYERLNHIVEIKIKVNEADLKRIETDIKLLGDSVYKAVERLSYAWNQGSNDNTRYGNIVQQIDTYNYQLDELNRLYAEGKISQSDYMDGLDSVRNSFYSQLEALIALDEEMRTYYSTTLKEASSELQFWNNQLDNATKVLDHYKKIVELSGYGGDYTRMGVLLEGQLQTKTNKYNSSKQWYDDLVNERERVMGQLYAAQSAGDIELVRRLQDKLKAIIEETANAEEQMFSDLEAVMEAIKAITENTVNKIHKDIEDKLTKGYGFDYLKNALSQLSEIQEQYLTKTNQVYETTKFLRQINQDMDKTDNAASKLKLQNFMSQVEQLKEQNKLSKLDLDIAKARYEVLLAQIALEDAQNAKSVVRLSRDSEGNYGYVYTADPDKINDAEQKLADKQNDLYNLVLNAYNENTQKLMDIYKDAEEQLAELQDLYYNQHAISAEMYEKKKQEIIQRYNDASFIYLQNIDTARNVLNEVALTDYTEAFASAYDNIYLNIEDYDTAILESTEQTEAAYERQVEALAKYAVPIIGESLDDLEKKTQNVTDASDELANTIENELEPALIDQVSNINDITYAYELQRDAILNIIDAIREQIRAIDALYEAEGRAVLEEANQEAEANDTIGKSITDLANDIQVGKSKIGGAPTPSETPDLSDNPTYETEAGFIVVKPGVESKKDNDYYVTSGGNINPAKLQKLPIKKYAFATGGYTGNWGDSSGRLALLHQKELVLNQEDTENILQAVDIIRQITSAIDLNAASAAAGLGYISSPAFGSTGSTLDQNVHIDATFPNVTDHNEIEQALSSLVNRAAQFANRK